MRLNIIETAIERVVCRGCPVFGELYIELAGEHYLIGDGFVPASLVMKQHIARGGIVAVGVE
ncbi:hypothetical protein D3C87_2058710 [compost metagenome]